MWCEFLHYLVIFFLVFDYVSCRLPYNNACPRVYLKNGRIRTKQRGRFLKFSCNAGFILAGERYSICQSDGTWDLPAPRCVKPTCPAKTQPPAFGLIFPSHGGGVLNFYCKSGYQLRGTSVMFCDGLKWDNHPPTCFPSNVKPKLFCDFEDSDICNWSQDWNHDFDWRRENYQTPSGTIGTGPSFDHTKGKEGKNGYYMYIESSSRRVNDTARLISPVFDKMPNNTCLEFWYHMYGATTGTLRAYIKKVSQPLPLDPKKAIFEKSGNQGNQWYRSFHNLGSLNEDFQIIMEGIRGNGYVSDIAIDDVKLIENCVYEDYIDTTTVAQTPESTETLKIIESCLNRCGHKADGFDVTNVISCDCDDSCFDRNRCCPDYYDICFISTSTYFYDTTSLDNATTEFVTDSKPENENINHETTEKLVEITKTPRKATTPVILKTTTTEKITSTTKKLITTPKSTPKITNTTPKFIVKTLPTTLSTKKLITTKKTTSTTKKVITTPKILVKSSITSKKPTTKPLTTSTTTQRITKNVTLSKKPITQPKEAIIQKSSTQPSILPNEDKSIETNDIADVPNNEKSEEILSDEDFSHYDEKEEFETPLFEHHRPKLTEIITIHGHEDTSNVKTIFIIVASCCGVAVVSLFVVILLVKYRILKIYGGKIQTNNGTRSQSDVRFLTADEALDFSMDSGSISSSTL